MRRRRGWLAKLLSVPVLAVCGFAIAATMAGVGMAGGTSTDTTTSPTSPPPTTVPTTTTTTTTTTQPTGAEGCTPGFWKNNADKKDASQWPMGFSPSQLVSSVFSAAPPEIGSLTLLQGLSLGGGGEEALTRQAIAAVLNAAHPDVDYPLTVTEIQTLVNEAFATGTDEEIEALKDMLDAANNAGCPIDQNP